MMSSLKQGLVHTVFFWLKESTEENKNALQAGLTKLAEIDLIGEAFIGQPAGTSREVIDGSYDLSITFIFPDKPTQDEYQTHPNHLKFIENCSHLWGRVQVYDAL
jgi:hypothetical protein